MKAQKNLLAIAVALSLGLSGAAFADQGGDGGPNVNTDDASSANNTVSEVEESYNADSSVETENEDSFNADSSTESEIEDSYNADSSTESEIEDSYNADSSTETENEDSFNADNSTETENEDSFNADNSTETETENEDSFNADNSTETETENEESFNTITENETENEGSFNTDSSTNSLDLSLTVFLNNADLDGSVSGVTTTYGDASARRAHTEVVNRNDISGGSANFTGVGAFAQNAGNASVTQANVSVMSNLSAGGSGSAGTQ